MTSHTLSNHLSIADEAEDLAQLWGTRAGFLVNSVRRDRAGWDHLFDMSFPREPKPGDPSGPAACAFSCRIQVKATASAQRSIPISLTNWKRALQDPLPWFFLLVQFDSGTVREVVLVHLGKALVERVMGRLCALPANATAQLHRKTLALRWRDGEPLSHPFERSLLRTIARAIGSDAFEYAKGKQRWYRNAGYKDKATLDVKGILGPHRPDDLCRRLARASVGLDALECSQVSLSRERFGRPEPVRAKGAVSARIEWGKSTGQRVLLNIHDHDGVHLASLPGWLRSSTSVFPLPREFWLLRFESLTIDMVVNVGANRCKVELKSLEDDEPVPLRALNDDLSFLKCLDDRRGQTLELTLSRDDYSARLACMTAPVTLGRGQYELAIDSSALWSLLGHLGAADASVQMTKKAIANYGYAARVMLTGRVGGAPDMFMDFAISPGEIDLAKPVTIVTNPRIKVDSITYMDIVALTGIPTALPEQSGQSWARIVPEQCRVLLSRRYVGNQVTSFDFSTVAASIESQLGKTGAEHQLGIDWCSFTEPSSSLAPS